MVIIIILTAALGAGLLALEYLLLKRHYQKNRRKGQADQGCGGPTDPDGQDGFGRNVSRGIAHEINNPLGFLISNLESLKDFARSLDPADKAAAKDDPLLIDDLKAMTEESLEGAKRIKRIVSDLRTFSRQSESSRTLTDINQILESTPFYRLERDKIQDYRGKGLPGQNQYHCRPYPAIPGLS